VAKSDPFPHELPILGKTLSFRASKLQKNIIRVRPRMFGFPNDGAVPAKRVAIKFFDGLYDVARRGLRVCSGPMQEGSCLRHRVWI
jgi:hypothetical protein